MGFLCVREILYCWQESLFQPTNPDRTFWAALFRARSRGASHEDFRELQRINLAKFRREAVAGFARSEPEIVIVTHILFEAVDGGDLCLLTELLNIGFRAAPFYCVGAYHPLYHASDLGNLAATKMLLDVGTSPNSDMLPGCWNALEGITAGGRRISSARRIDIIRLLMVHGANLEEIGRDGRNAWIRSVLAFHYQIAIVLMEEFRFLPSRPDLIIALDHMTTNTPLNYGRFVSDFGPVALGQLLFAVRVLLG